MKKYWKYIIIFLLLILCIFLLQYVFLKENNQLTEYKQKFQEQMQSINNATGIDDNNINPATNVNSNPATGIDIPPATSVIDQDPMIKSNTELLNKQGEALLKELSRELENSIITIKESDGTVDTNMLNKDN
ncbi:MAG: hypothetical protein PHH22_01930 [Clostridia bacterium]|nr:hypothetical protein [Clostridia bacterium]